MSGKTFVSAAVFAALFLLPGFALGQASTPADQPDSPAPADTEAPAAAADESAIFDSAGFDRTVAEGKKAADAEKAAWLVGGTVLMDSRYLTTAALDGWSAESDFSGKAFAKLTVPDYGNLFVSYNLSYPVLSGSSGNAVLAPGSGNPDSIDLALSEFHYSFDIAKAVFVRIGKQLISWGPARIWTPIDFINRTKASQLDMLDFRLGTPGVRLHVPMNGSNLFMFADFSDTRSGAELKSLDATTFSARLDATVPDFELGLTGFFGKDTKAKAGFDASGRAFGFDMYGEYAIVFSSAPVGFPSSLSLGFLKSPDDLKRWIIQGEVFFNSDGTGNSARYPDLVASNTFNPLYVGSAYGYAAVTKKELGVSFLDATASVLSDASDGSYMVKFETEFTIPQVPPFDFAVSYFGGETGRALTWYSGNHAITMELWVRVEF
jgi:hypothetical protein